MSSPITREFVSNTWLDMITRSFWSSQCGVCGHALGGVDSAAKPANGHIRARFHCTSDIHDFVSASIGDWMGILCFNESYTAILRCSDDFVSIE